MPTTAVLAPPRETGLKRGFAALLRSSGDDSKAAPLRQPLLRDIASCEMFFFSLTNTVSRQRLA